MNDFKFWSPKLHSLYEDAVTFLEVNVNAKASAKMIITGQINSGKTVFTEKIIEKIWINKELNKKIGDIIKVNFDDFLFIKHLKKEKKSLLWDVMNFIEPTLSVPVGPIEASVNLSKALNRYFSPEKITILWFENVTKYESLSIEKVLNIISDYTEFPTISIITTHDNKVVASLNKFDADNKSFTMPKITQKDFLEYKKSPAQNPDAQQLEILNELISLGSSKEANNIIRLGQGAYGNIEQLIALSRSNSISATVEIQKLIEAIFEINTSNDDEKNKLLMNLFIFPAGVSWDWLEELFKNSRFDYVGELEKLLQNQLIIKKDGRFMINKNLPIAQSDYLSFYKNKRDIQSSAKVLDLLLRKEFPEKYSLRAETAALFDKNLAITYRFIYDLRSAHDSSNYFIQKDFINQKNLRFLLNLLKTSLEVEKDSKEKDRWLHKIENQLNAIKERELPLLILAEYSYFKLRLFLAYSYELRKRIHPKIELYLQKMIHIFDDLIKNNETEMAIKLGLLIAPEIINYMSHEDIPEANQIYKQVQKMLYNFLKKNRTYYQYYDIVCKFVSTSILSYRKANGNLWDLVNEFQEPNNKLLINYSGLFPMIFSNLLGMSFYLGYSEMDEALALYRKNKTVINSFKPKNYKIINNIQLASLLKTTSTKRCVQKYLIPFEELKENHVSAINYAGVLFYSKKYDKARETLEEIHKIENKDDFYVFFCEYNSVLIDYANKSVEKDKIINKLKNLEIPSLFTDKPTIKRYERRLKFLIQAIKNDYETDVIRLEKELNNHLKEPVPIFNKLWLFSDYQYWS